MKKKSVLIYIAIIAFLATGIILTGCGGSSSTPPVSSTYSYSFTSAAPKFAIVGNDVCSSVVSVFTVNAGTGALTEVSTSPVTVYAGCPVVTVHPNGKWIYVADYSGPTIQAFSIDSSGKLTQIGNLVANTGYTGTAPVFSADGKYLFTADSDSFVSAFSIDGTTGALTSLGSVDAGSLNDATYFSSLGPITFAGNYLYTSTYGGGEGGTPLLFGFTVSPSGTPVSITGSPWIDESSRLYNMVADMSGAFLYVGNGNGSITGYSVNSRGSLTQLIAGFPVLLSQANLPPALIQNMVFEPRNKFLYISDARNGVWGYSFNSTTGALTMITGSPFAAGSYPWGLTADPSGTFLYVANGSSNNITGYTINQTTGVLTPMNSTYAPSSMQTNSNIAITY